MGKASKVIFFDVDGTLFRHDCRVPASTVEAINKCAENGHYIFLCTGRGASTIPKEVRDLPLHGEICSCGTYVSLYDQVIVNRGVEGADCDKILKILHDLKCPSFVENPDYFYYDPDYLPEGFHKVIDTMHANYPGKFRPIDMLPARINKMTGYPEDKALIPQIIEALSPWFDVIVHEEYSYIEITVRGFTKGTGVHAVLDALDIHRSNAYGFGDSANDIPMLDEVGYGIVMGDAPQALKDKYIETDSLYADGVANALKRFGLI